VSKSKNFLHLNKTLQPSREYLLALQTNNTPGLPRKNNDTSSVALPSTAAHSSQSQVQKTAPQVRCRARRLLPRSGIPFHHPQATTVPATGSRLLPLSNNNPAGTKNISMLAASQWSLPWLPGNGPGPRPRPRFNGDGDAAALGSPIRRSVLGQVR